MTRTSARLRVLVSGAGHSPETRRPETTAIPRPESTAFAIRLDDLSGQATRALIARHLAGMHNSSPPESVHAFSVAQLRQPDVLFWSAWALAA